MQERRSLAVVLWQQRCTPVALSLEHFRRLERSILAIRQTNWPLRTTPKPRMQWRANGKVQARGLQRYGKRAR
jgi:hypothetical protein